MVVVVGEELFTLPLHFSKNPRNLSISKRVVRKEKNWVICRTWMDLETVIQSEASQKEKNKYRILKHICGS